MIEIRIGEPVALINNVLVKYSAFISFKYDAKIVKYLQECTVRAYNPQDKSWEIPINLLPKFCNEFQDRDIKVYGIYHNIQESNDVDLPEGFTFKTKPFDHQVEAVKYGLKMSKFILADEQGLGKTKSILDLSRALPDVNKVLIVCGVNGLKYNWETEIHTHTDEKCMILGNRVNSKGKRKAGSFNDKMEDLNNLPKDIKYIITNVETLRAGVIKTTHGRRTSYEFPVANKIKELCDNGTISMIAFDEAHKAKNVDSLQGKAILKISAKYMIAATGTPIMNNPLDCYFPLHWLGYENSSFYIFKQHYCIMGGAFGGEILGYKNMPQLRGILAQVMLRRTKDEVLNLPEKIRSIEYVEMTPKQEKIYAEVTADVKKHIDKVMYSNNPMAELIRLRQATGYTGILSEEIKESAKLDRMEELVEEIIENGRKCIIFSNWTSITDVAKERLQKYNPAYITGALNDSERDIEKTRFQNDENCKVCIGTIGAMGTGLTLTAAQTAIFLDSPWNRALKDQAEDRIHRIGTKGAVNIITICCTGTIDERIEDLVYRKGLISDMLLDKNGNKINKELLLQLIG